MRLDSTIGNRPHEHSAVSALQNLFLLSHDVLCCLVCETTYCMQLKLRSTTLTSLLIEMFAELHHMMVVDVFCWGKSMLATTATSTPLMSHACWGP